MALYRFKIIRKEKERIFTVKDVKVNLEKSNHLYPLFHWVNLIRFSSLVYLLQSKSEVEMIDFTIFY